MKLSETLNSQKNISNEFQDTQSIIHFVAFSSKAYL